MKKYHFVAISGSLRQGSFNTMALQAAQQLVPANVTIEHLSIEDVPMYNFDLYDNHPPDIIEKLSKAIKAADALILVTPEYNYSIPGVLKNVIDFLSKHPDKPFDFKPVGIMGASPSSLGTARAQYHLRQTLVAVNALTLNQPEIMVAQANTKFDKEGHLTDEPTKAIISKFIVSLSEFCARVSA